MESLGYFSSSPDATGLLCNDPTAGKEMGLCSRQPGHRCLNNNKLGAVAFAVMGKDKTGEGCNQDLKDRFWYFFGVGDSVHFAFSRSTWDTIANCKLQN